MYATLATVLGLFSACFDLGDDILPASTGNAGDLVVVMDSTYWNGQSGKAAVECFQAIQEGLPQAEYRFNVIDVETHEFRQIFRTTRNIVVLEHENNSEKASYAEQKNVWAENQVVLLIKAPGDKAAAEILKKNCENIAGLFQEAEWKRLQHAYEKLGNKELQATAMGIIGYELTIPSDYKVALKSDSLLWLRKDFEHKGHQINMGLTVYTTGYDSLGSLDADQIIAERNRFAKAISGPVEGSYMSTYDEYKPAEREIGFSNKYAKEFRGLWNMKGAFMGGPFVHYVFVDKTGRKIVHIDGYVFAPKFDKREYLRELEAIALSALR